MAEPNPKISLIIPAYNEENYIGACLEHVQKNATDKFFEIIVVDNASIDRTCEVAKSFSGVRVIREEKKGLTQARERGFREAGGDILAYIDADTKMPPDWFNAIAREFSDNPKLAILSGPYSYYDLTLWQKPFINLYFFCARPFYRFFGYMMIGGNFAVKRGVLEKMRGFDTSISFYGEDTDIARRAHQFGEVKFDAKLIMLTSARRLRYQGIFKTAIIYTVNYLWVALRGKPITKKYIDVR